MPRLPGLKKIAFDDWPERDRAGWQAALAFGGILGDSGALAQRPEHDLSRYRQTYGTWLAFLADSNQVQPLASGVDHFRETEVRGFLELLETRLAPCSILSFLVNLRTAARALRTTVQLPLLDRAIRHYKRTAKPTGNKEARMQDIGVLRDLGLRLMTQPQRATAEMRHANQYRDGLAIAMLTAEPLRIGDFGTLQMNRNIRRLSDRYTVDVAETKNGESITFDLPLWLTEPMDLYLARYRPYLLARRGRWWTSTPEYAFWVSSNGTAMTAQQLSRRIVHRTREAFGRPVNPHLFRDICATTIAIEDPQHVGMILSILGHRSPKTGEKHYNHAKSWQAGLRYQEALQDFVKPSGE
jgi:integrase